MKKFFIILLSVLIGTFLGTSYFIYKKNYLSNKTILKPNEISTEIKPKRFNYQIPVANIKNQSSPTSSQIQQNQPKNVSLLENSTIKKQLNVSQDYLIYYQDSINDFNKISNSLKNLQQTLIEIGKNYNDKNYLALPSLISKTSDENSDFIRTVSELKNSFDNWLIVNKNITNEIIKQKTDQVIGAGFNYVQSSLDFSKAVDEILAFKGIGDFNQLSENLQEAAQKMGTDGKKLNELFGELNNVLI